MRWTKLEKAKKEIRKCLKPMTKDEFTMYGAEHFKLARDTLKSQAYDSNGYNLEYINSLKVNYEILTDDKILQLLISFIGIVVGVIVGIAFGTATKDNGNTIIYSGILMLIIAICYAVISIKTKHNHKEQFYKRVVDDLYEDIKREIAEGAKSMNDGSDKGDSTINVIKDLKGEKKDIGQNPEAVIEIARSEYEHCIKRMNRLDNKIYILLTVCAFVFIMLTGVIGDIGSIRLPKGLFDSVLLIVYLTLVVVTIIRVIILLKGLINALSTIKLQRFDSADILDYDMVHADISQVAGYVVAIYESSRKINNERIDNKYDTLQKSVDRLVKVSILVIVLALLGAFIPRASMVDKPLSDAMLVLMENYSCKGW